VFDQPLNAVRCAHSGDGGQDEVEEQAVQPDLNVSTVRDGDRAIVEVVGELDAHSAPALDDELARLTGASVNDVVLDLSATSFLDSFGLRALLAAQREVADRGGRLSLRNPSKPVQRLLDIAGLTEQFVMES
jgi:anti-anti-sigma factor